MVTFRPRGPSDRALPLERSQPHPRTLSWPWGSCPLTPALGCWAQGSTGPGCEHSQHPVCLQVTFTITNENHKFHGLPLLSPWSYTTYRGSLQLTGSQPVTLDMVPQQPSHPQAAGRECSSWAPGSHFPWDILAPCHRCRCHSVQRTNSWEKTLMLGKIEGGRRRGDRE